MKHWNPDSPEFTTVKKTIDNTPGIGNTPTGAVNLVACGVERAIAAGVTPTDLRGVVDEAITHAEQTTGQTANSGR